MTEKYKTIMNEMGYNHLVCDIFDHWEGVKDEILLQERKDGTGNGTVHVFLGNADNALRHEFSKYYLEVEEKGDTNNGATIINHYFLKSNILSMIGSMCQFCKTKRIDYHQTVEKILKEIEDKPTYNGLLHTTSLFKLSMGSNKLRPYFKQFDSDGIFHKVVRLLLIPNSAYRIYLLKNDNGEYAAFWLIGFNNLDDFEVDSTIDNIDNDINKAPLALQQIYYGAPGTGKSHGIKKLLKEMNVPKENIFRTTFHPDSDYSSFVGAYKPTMKPVDEKYRNVVGKDEEIAYSFVPQTFIKAYIQAYKKPNENVYIIIEEINRGNCAQIFGDLFQLLDRDDNGVSEYPIKADSDLKMYLEGELKDYPDGIKDGELCLPSNLYIWATMNTSDQSLFPIDSAFKRRWDWEYEPIKYKNKDWVIEIAGNKYSWISFQRIINDMIFEATNSEDKMLGDYFVKPCNNIISEKQFVNKVLFYLWNDVCKDGDGDIFRTSDNKDVKFSDLYDDNGSNTLQSMMDYLGIKPISDDFDDDEEDNDENEENDGLKIKYSINGEKTNEKNKAWGKGDLVKRAVEIYCQKHPQDTAVQIRNEWMSVGFLIPHIVETDEDKSLRLARSNDSNSNNRSKEIKLSNGESLHISTQVGDGKQRKGFSDFLSKIKAKPEWGIIIKELN